MRSRASGERGHERRHPLLGDVAAGEHHERLGRGGLARLERPAYSPSSTVSSPFTGPARRRRGVQLREAERALRNAQAERLHGLADPAADAARGTRASSRALQTSCQSTTSRKRRSGRTSAAASSEKYGNDAVWTTS